MPDNSAYLTALGASGHKLQGWFFLFEKGDPVLIADVTATPSFPTYNVSISVVSGSVSDVDYGMIYEVYTAGGLYKGMGTLRYGGAISSTNIPVRELSRGSIDVASGDVIKVYRYFLPVDKLVGATAEFNPDGLGYTDQGSNPPPVANDYGAWAGKSSQLPIPFANSLGYVVDPDSSSAVTVSRTLPSGLSYASGGNTTLDVTVTGDEGTYWVKAVVTDPDNGKSTTRYTPVCIDDSPLDCTVEPYGGDVDNGWRMTVTFRGTVDISEGTWGAFVAREFIDGVEGSYGSAASGRSHIKFFGIVRRRSFESDGTGAYSVSYEFLSPLAWLLETPGFSKVMLDKASPANWMEMKTLDTKRAPLQIIQFYSNSNQIGSDWTFRPNYRVKRYPGFFIEKNTPIGQLRELASGVGAKLICTRQGNFEFVTDPRFLPLASRSSVAVMLALSNDHIIRASFQQEMKDVVEKMYFSGFVAGASNNAPFRISFPGKAPGTGTQSPQFDKMICDSITDAEEEAGRRGGMVQQVFHDENKQKHRIVTGELVLYGSFDVFDLYGEWITLPQIPNAAGVDTSAYRFVIDSINVEYTAGTARITLRVSGETNAPKGQYDPPPVETNAGDLDYPWDLTAPIVLAPVGGSRVPAWDGIDILPTRVIVFDAGGAHCHVATAWAPSLSSLIYTDASSGLSGSVIWATADTWNYSRYFPITTDGLFRNDDPFGGGSWSLVADNTTLFGGSSYRGRKVITSINRRGWIAINSGNGYVVTTGDYGGTWQNNGGTPGTGLDEFSCDIAVSPHNNGSEGWMYMSLYAGGDLTIRKSVDWGLTWTTIRSGGGMASNFTNGSLNIPYKKPDGSLNLNNASQIIYCNTQGSIWRSVDAGITWSQRWGAGSTGQPQPTWARTGWSIQTFTHNSDVVLSIARTAGAGGDGMYMRYSDDGGATSIVPPVLVQSGGGVGNGNAFCNGYAEHSMVMLAFARTHNRLWWSPDGTVTVGSAAGPSGYSGIAYAEFGDLALKIPPG